jgi:hypothetical protein
VAQAKEGGQRPRRRIGLVTRFALTSAIVITVLAFSALSVSGALFLILEMDRPFEGMLQISQAPLQDALAHLGQ